MRKPPNYWNKERCREVALRCETKTEFRNMSVSAYNNSWEFGWLDEFCQHMNNNGNIKKRLVYSYEFSDNCVYIGLTYNVNIRERRHLYTDPNSPVLRHKKKYKIMPVRKILSDGYVDSNKAQNLEKYWVEFYERNNWRILNKNITGGLGGNILKWDKENCWKISSLCKTRKEFYDKNSSTYISARKNKWLNEICQHMTYLKKPKGYWTFDECSRASKLVKTRFEFSRKFSRAYTISLKNKWLDDFFK